MKLLPTPCANQSGNTPEEHLRKKPGRSTVTDLAVLVEGGLIATGGKLLPTPRTTDAQGAGTHGDGGLDLRTTASHAEKVSGWGPYMAAIRRWEGVTDRAVPDPVELNSNGNYRLNVRFSEWMMGWPEGWVTDLITTNRKLYKEGMISRTAAMRMIGNGVVPQQAIMAIGELMEEW